MSGFKCSFCGTDIIDTPTGYVTECEHWPKERYTKQDYDMLDSAELLIADCDAAKIADES